MRAALAKRDFGKVYRLLQKVGYSQQRIAALTGQSQPEVSAIIHGRRVMALDVIERIVWGLQIPPPYAGLVCDSCRGTACAPAKPAASRGERTGLNGALMAGDADHTTRVADAVADMPLSDVPARLPTDHEDARTHREIMAAYTRLQSDADGWAAYQAELEEWDGPVRTTGELLETTIGSDSRPSDAGEGKEDGCES